MEGKTVSYSRLETRLRPQPHESNVAGVMHGGMILYHLDMACGMTAMRHAGSRVVTVSVDRMDFKRPVHMGENMLYKTSVNMAHKSSMEVGARIEAENGMTGELRHVGTAYLSFVALNESGRPTTVRPLIAETDDEKRRMADAVRRRNLRRMERWQANGKAFAFTVDLLPEPFMLCRLEPGAPVPALPAGSFSALVAGHDGVSLVMPESACLAPGLENGPLHAVCGSPSTRMEKGWRAFALRDTFDLTVSGVVANVSAILAAEKISLQYVSSFGAGYFLVPGRDVDAAREALVMAGHAVVES